MSEWISVEDRLPDAEQDVLCFCTRHSSVGMTVAGLFARSLDDDQLEWMSFETEYETKYTVTHWMPLPAPPSA